MANTINTNYLQYTRQLGQNNKRASVEKGSGDFKSMMEKFGDSASVEFSEEGLSALQQNTPALQVRKNDSDASQSNAQQLSPKAQALLEKLREQYGDYEFIATEKIDDSARSMGTGTKPYSVILTNAELEKMAEDEEYTQEVMGKVKDAVDMADRISEKAEQEAGVRISHVSIAFDEKGNTKLFAQLEKMSEAQQERLEKMKEKQAEEADKAEKEKDEEQLKEQLSIKRTTIEASSEEDFWEKLLGIDWENIAAEEA